MPFTLLSLDIDGTLLAADGTLPPANVKAVQRVAAQGVRIVLNTGRMVPNIEPIVDQLGVDPIVCAYNGAKVLAPRSEGRTALLHKPIAAGHAVQIVEAAMAASWLLFFYHEDCIYTEFRTGLWERYAPEVNYKIVPLEQLRGLSATKLIAVSDPAHMDAVREQLVPAVAGLSVVRSESEYMEMMAPGVNKGAVLQFVAEYAGVPIESCLAMGDGGNDIEMLDVAGLGVAVANARGDVKAAADVVIQETADDAAVAACIDRYFAR
ncbi:MAG: Cof-type HAD-IIB family hydrolase [Gammaproteobacteria bacterium]|nr:Cof-type HAD-IIB family hydrolase [Gammaproteobacteria bacterium]